MLTTLYYYNAFSLTDAHLYVYRCRAVKLPQACGKATAAERQSYHRPVVDVKVFIEKRNGLGSRLIMTKLGTLRSQFMRTSVYKGEFSIYAERRFSFPEIRQYLNFSLKKSFPYLAGMWLEILILISDLGWTG